MIVCTGKRGGFLKELVIRLHSFQDVQDIRLLSEKMSFKATLSDGRRDVDVGSMMQLFCLNLQEELRLQIECGDEIYPAVYEQLKRLEVS